VDENEEQGACYIKLLKEVEGWKYTGHAKKFDLRLLMYNGSANFAARHQYQPKKRETAATISAFDVFTVFEGSLEAARALEYTLITCKRIKFSEDEEEELEDKLMVNCYIPFPRIPPSIESGFEGEKKMRQLAVAILLDAIKLRNVMELELANDVEETP